MDATTWRDGAVAQWIRKYAIAIQVDSDLDPSASGLNVKALPCLIVFRDGQELDRVVGARSAQELLCCLNGLLERRPEIGTLLEDNDSNVSVRQKLAWRLLHEGRHEEALREWLHLWRDEKGQESLYPGLVRLLTEEYPAAQVAIEIERELLADMRHDFKALRKWLCLTHGLGKTEEILEWFDNADNSDFDRRLSDLSLRDARTARSIEHVLQSTLTEHNRWEQLGRILISAQLQIEEAWQHCLFQQVLRSAEENNRWEDVDRLFMESQIEEGRLGVRVDPSDPIYPSVLQSELLGEFRHNVAVLVRALRAAGRHAEEQRVVARALELDRSPEMKAALDEVGVFTAASTSSQGQEPPP
jgi:hypothetical protein